MHVVWSRDLQQKLGEGCRFGKVHHVDQVKICYVVELKELEIRTRVQSYSTTVLEDIKGNSARF
jgi:hypothetical protein